VVPMPQIRVSAEDVTALGETLFEARDALLGIVDGLLDDNRWAFGTARSGDVLDEVLGNWRHRRLELARHLDDLGAAAQAAGGAYVEVEAANLRLTGGGQLR
jgi:hypothetical protein